MPAPAVTKFGGDVRLWRKTALGALIPVILEANDPTGNQPIEANAMVFSREEGETIEIASKRRGTRYNQPIYSEQEPGTTSMALTLLEVPPLILGRVLFGEAATEVTVAAGTATSAPVTGIVKDRPVQLPHRYLSDTVAPVVEKDGTPLIAGTDYTIDYRRGQIMFRSAAVSAGDTDVTISYTYAGYTYIDIAGGGTPTETFYVTGDMENRVTGDDGELVVYEWRASVDGEVDLFGSEPISPTLTGPCIVPADQEAPYNFRVIKAAA